MAQVFPDANTALGTLQNGFQSIEGFGGMISQAYAVPGAEYIAPVFLIVMLAIAVYGKTQNIPVTATAIVLTLAVWGSYVASSQVGGRVVQVLIGAVVLGIAWIVVRKVVSYE